MSEPILHALSIALEATYFEEPSDTWRDSAREAVVLARQEMDRLRASEAALREENERLRRALQQISDIDGDAETRDIADAALSKEPTR